MPQKSITKKCSILNCKNFCKSNSSPYCEKHYYRKRRTGTAKERKRKYSINSNIFDNMNGAKAWILGLIWSDGNISYNRIHISSKDLVMLKRVEEILEAKNCIHKYTKQNAYYLSFSNKKIADRLRSFGLHACKSLTIKAPKNLDKNLELHFLRGVFDGDGCVGLKKFRIPRLSVNIVSASCDFANYIYETFLRYKIKCSIYNRLGYKSKNQMYTVVANSHIECCKIFELFYDKNTQNEKNYLPRKYNKFKTGYDAPRKLKVGRKKRIYDKNTMTKREKAIINDYLYVSKTIEKTANKFKYGSSVLKILKNFNISTYGRSQFCRLTKKEKSKIIKDRKKGLTFKQIQKKYKINRNTTRKVLQEDFV